MEGFKVLVAETSKELTAKERVMVKDTTDCVKLDEATQQGAVTIDVDYYVVLNVHNEKSDNKDYKNYVVVDKDGTKYVTGSTSFWSSFTNIAEEMEDVNEEYKIKVYRADSKNYKGKQFITCAIV